MCACACVCVYVCVCAVQQTLDLYGEDAFDTGGRTDVKMLDLKDGPKASAYVSELRARQLVIPFMVCCSVLQ